MKRSIRIGNAQAFWGDRGDAAAELLALEPDLDYLTMDYLAEVSMSILAIQRERDPGLGYPKDFVEVVRVLSSYWAGGGRCRLVVNAGGLNPMGCAKACAAVLEKSGCRSMKIGVVSGDDVLAVLKPCWQTRPETARRIRMRIEKVLDAAKVKGLRTGENPARWRGQLDHILPRHTKSTDDHHNAMPYGEVPAFLASLEQKRGFSVLALRFAILTAARTGEVIGARWEEIDMEAGLWTIPAQRMKARRAHRVPLADPVLEVLREVQGALSYSPKIGQ